MGWLVRVFCAFSNLMLNNKRIVVCCVTFLLVGVIAAMLIDAKSPDDNREIYQTVIKNIQPQLQ